MNPEFLLEVNNVSKAFHGLAGAKQLILEEINFNISPSNNGNIITFLSPTNSSKTELFKIIAAIEKPSAGEIILQGRKYENPTGEIVFIPEKPSSFPWMSVKQNVEFVLSLKNNNQIKQEKIAEIISLVGLSGYEDHFPNDKSLGFRFRISFARALAVNPKIILLDEPLKNLHSETKKEIISLITYLTNQLNLTILISMANITEAILISNKIILMSLHPGKTIGEFEIDKTQNLQQHTDYFNSIKHSIEKSFQL